MRDLYKRKEKLEYWIQRVNTDLHGTDKIDVKKLIQFIGLQYSRNNIANQICSRTIYQREDVHTFYAKETRRGHRLDTENSYMTFYFRL